jgi:CheY-like chemotaxis protein
MKDTSQRVVLVADDNPRWRNIVVDVLQRKGYLVKIATCYEEAANSIEILRACRSIRLSLAVVDLLLDQTKVDKSPKEIEDYEGAKLLPLLSDLAIPCIVLTGYGSDVAIVKKVLDEYRPYRFLEKGLGFNVNTFSDTVDQAPIPGYQRPKRLGTIADYVVSSLMGLVTFGGIIGVLILASQVSESGAGLFALVVLGVFIWFILLVFTAQRSGAIEQSRFGQLLERILNVIERLLFPQGGARG